uniref:Neuropeptide Grb-AST B1 n=1 Tax=Gryllus bimaculatus TaxID=6999 RepID=Q7M3N9_GRYBI|nr:juvenile hormone inhibitory neuropeptide grb-AST:SUBUNIT=B1 [Gryllus bimaculatus]
GWQDLNGGW